MTDPVDDRTRSLGDLLRAAREGRGLSVQDVAAITRIPQRHLHAIERGQLDALPAGMYRRAEVRTYAETVGLDKAVALARLDELLGPATATPAVAAPALAEPASPRNLTYAVVVLGGLLAAGVVTYGWWAKPSATTAEDEAAVAAAVAAQSQASSSTSSSEAIPDNATPPPAPEHGPPAVVPAMRTSTLASAPAPAPESAIASESTRAAEAAKSNDAPAVALQPPTLTVTSSPPGARVLVDGIGYGRTPITIRHLQLGQRSVRVVLDGHVSAQRQVRLDRSPATLDVTLAPLP